ASVSPRLRAAAKRRAQIRDRVTAAYDAAQTTPENAKHWRWADSLSAAQANSADIRSTIRDRARYEVANNSFASGIVDTLANDIVGTGPRLQIQTNDDAVNRQVETAWNAWAQAVNLPGKLRTAIRARIVDGEAFLQRGDRQRGTTPVTLNIHGIECDQMDDPQDSASDPTHVAGVYLENGEPVGYDKLNYHPGDHHGYTMTASRIDADDVIHIYRQDRPGQLRGISQLTPSLPLGAILRRYTLATLLAAEIFADHTLFLESGASEFDDEDADEVDAFDAVDIDRGMITAMPKGWKVNGIDPKQPVATYKEFRDAILNEFARCVHMPRGRALADFSGYNYASGRLDELSYWSAIDIEHADIERLVLERIFGWWFDESILIPGYLPSLPAYHHGLPKRWYWAGRKHADPAKEAAAAKILQSIGYLTDDEYLFANGTDPESHHQQRTRDARRRREIADIETPAPKQGAAT
ncbi:MAG: phage portal protein, partial [Planctomycetota bacterium]